MNRRIKLLVTIPLVLLIALIGVKATWAGLYQNVSVHIGNNVAQGNVSSTRRSSDPLEYIGCEVTVKKTGGQGSCIAYDTAGVRAFCKVTDASWLPVIEMINETSNIKFSWTTPQTGDPECDSLTVANGSRFLH
ncbi:MAG: hypothetical protein IPK82_38380 [Polyangiaceae bacterium]|nr:hypothetical protein [Polyangiaceae bacterium]